MLQFVSATFSMSQFIINSLVDNTEKIINIFSLVFEVVANEGEIFGWLPAPVYVIVCTIIIVAVLLRIYDLVPLL